MSFERECHDLRKSYEATSRKMEGASDDYAQKRKD